MIAALLLSLAIQDAGTAPVAAPKPKPEHKTCRAAESTGSRMASARECHTAAEWRAKEGSVDDHQIDRLKAASGIGQH